MRIFEGFQKGVNLGGWISQFAVFDEKHFNTFITENDIRTIAKLGFDHVRVPIDYTVLEDEEGNLRESGFNHLSDCRRWCETCGLSMNATVILLIHSRVEWTANVSSMMNLFKSAF